MSNRASRLRLTGLTGLASCLIGAGLFASCDLGGSDNTGNNNTPTKCAVDYDCLAGQVCGSDKTCTKAATGAQRNYGDVALDFTDAAAEYVVALYSVPADGQAESPAGENSATLKPDASTDTAKSGQGGGRSTDASSALLQEWQAKLAMDAARYERVGRLVESLQAGETYWPVNPSRDTTCPASCESGKVCIKGSCVDTASFNYFNGATKTAITASLVAQFTEAGHAVAIFVDDTDSASVNQSDVQELADTFGNIIGKRDRLFFGETAKHEGVIDRDGNGAMVIVMSSALCGLNVLGYFDDRDFMASTMAEASQNEADILWVRALGTTGQCTTDANQPKILGTLAHEYQHLINYGRRVYGRTADPIREVLWLDEGLAHLAEDITGYGKTNIPVVVYYLAEAQFANVSFSHSYPMTGNTANQHIAMRGAAYLFMRFVFEQLGGATYSASVASQIEDGGGMAFLKKLYTTGDMGITNVEQAGGKVFSDWMKDFVFALYLDGFEAGDIYSGLSPLGYNTPQDDALTGQKRGIQLRNASFEDADGTEWPLDGPPQEELNNDFNIDTTFPIGGVQYFLLSGGDGALKLKGMADATLDVKVRSWRLK